MRAGTSPEPKHWLLLTGKNEVRREQNDRQANSRQFFSRPPQSIEDRPLPPIQAMLTISHSMMQFPPLGPAVLLWPIGIVVSVPLSSKWHAAISIAPRLVPW